MTLLLSPWSNWFPSLPLSTASSRNDEALSGSHVWSSHGVPVLGPTHILQLPSVLVGFNCQLDTFYHHLSGRPQLKSCLDQMPVGMSLKGLFWLLTDAGEFTPLWVVPYPR